jgi:hypothetical protein
MPVILHGDGLHKHYVGTAGRGQVISALLFLSVSPAFANCYKVDTLLGYEVRCSDGNNYRVEQNSLTDQTIIKGTNPNTGSNWKQLEA